MYVREWRETVVQHTIIVNIVLATDDCQGMRGLSSSSSPATVEERGREEKREGEREGGREGGREKRREILVINAASKVLGRNKHPE